MSDNCTLVCPIRVWDEGFGRLRRRAIGIGRGIAGSVGDRGLSCRLGAATVLYGTQHEVLASLAPTNPSFVPRCAGVDRGDEKSRMKGPQD